MNLSTFEVVILCEAVAAIVIIMVVIAVAAAIKTRKKAKGGLYDPYGLYAPASAEDLAEMERAAALVDAEARQLQQNAHNTQ